MNILNNLKSNFGLVEPIMEQQILDLGYTKEDIEDTLEENVFEKVDLGIPEFDFGNVYVLPEYVDLLEEYVNTVSEQDFILKYFTGNNFEYGYFSGLCVMNVIHLSEQMFMEKVIYSIRTNKELYFNIGCMRIKVLPILSDYNQSNAFNIMLAFALNNYIEFFDYCWKDEFRKLKDASLINANILLMIKELKILNEARDIFAQ